ncbi:MAG: element excision factor XisH family protein [Saprospiraceae bacterium]
MAKDLYHESVMKALEKDGWEIVKENYRLTVDEKLIYLIDILAEKYIVATKETQWIIVEVKSFNRLSSTHEFHSAIGQYITYHTALEYLGIDKKLFLAIPVITYNELFQLPFIKYLIEKYNIQLLPFHPDKKSLL